MSYNQYSSSQSGSHPDRTYLFGGDTQDQDYGPPDNYGQSMGFEITPGYGANIYHTPQPQQNLQAPFLAPLDGSVSTCTPSSDPSQDESILFSPQTNASSNFPEDTTPPSPLENRGRRTSGVGTGYYEVVAVDYAKSEAPPPGAHQHNSVYNQDADLQLDGHRRPQIPPSLPTLSLLRHRLHSRRGSATLSGMGGHLDGRLDRRYESAGTFERDPRIYGNSTGGQHHYAADLVMSPEPTSAELSDSSDSMLVQSGSPHTSGDDHAGDRRHPARPRAVRPTNISPETRGPSNRGWGQSFITPTGRAREGRQGYNDMGHPAAQHGPACPREQPPGALHYYHLPSPSGSQQQQQQPGGRRGDGHHEAPAPPIPAASARQTSQQRGPPAVRASPQLASAGDVTGTLTFVRAGRYPPTRGYPPTPAPGLAFRHSGNYGGGQRQYVDLLPPPQHEHEPWWQGDDDVSYLPYDLSYGDRDAETE